MPQRLLEKQQSRSGRARRGSGSPRGDTEQRQSHHHQENLLTDDSVQFIHDDEFYQMENKASALTYKNRGMSSQAMARIAPILGKRTVHEINIEDI